ncbi:PP2C family serine/threonine-protein phosphatase [Streptacidiphilus jiangxiensis]|uniref:Protein phosphatase 2C n=1 Tax=Streptacidiphilus jiangxiensis TaxID=235985 RepID=A0A1H8B2K7_STRJI|nr:PP2C family serine/threonine-protein phosphatase [Streptacidiphilus jiangxiensis]SEM77151.1 Protein phosphatase 2C [Streptacidiphilus jiangxiensis]
MHSSTMKITTATRAGSPHVACEDRVRTGPGLVVVVDGVTTVADGADVLGGTYADVLAGEVLALASDPRTDLRTALADGISRTTQALQLPPQTVPGSSAQATVTVGRVRGTRFEAAAIGDSPVAAIGIDGSVRVLTDNRLATLVRDRPARLEQWERLRSGAGRIGDQRHRELMQEIMRGLADAVNTPGGYWIAGADPRAGQHAVIADWPLDELADILVVTDGISVAVDKYQVLTWPQIARLCRTEGPEAVLTLVEEADASDPFGQRWPRAKPGDDKGLGHLQLTA